MNFSIDQIYRVQTVVNNNIVIAKDSNGRELIAIGKGLGFKKDKNEGALMRLETQALAEQYRDRLFAAAFQVCGNAADAEDAAQEALLRYHLSDKQFESQEHIRAWLLRVAINWAKNTSRSLWRRNTVTLADYM